jgi:hypothetical protein
MKTDKVNWKALKSKKKFLDAGMIKRVVIGKNVGMTVIEK